MAQRQLDHHKVGAPDENDGKGKQEMAQRQCFGHALIVAVRLQAAWSACQAGD
jgi:hypothetical protein